MKILSIETSCDETAISIIEASGGLNSPKFNILGNALYSQIDTHSEYGGVFPMLAKREHGKNIVPLLRSALEQVAEKLQEKNDDSNESQATQFSTISLSDEKKSLMQKVLEREDTVYEQLIEFFENSAPEFPNIDAIAVTEGPGLEPALWVGISFAKALAIALDKPIIPVNHMEGHIVSVLMEEQGTLQSLAQENTAKQGAIIQDTVQKTEVQFPALALLISGGHTELVQIDNWHEYKVIGQTLDDAIGEAFDKVARLMDLSYPGGPKISKLAAESRAKNLTEKFVQTQTASDSKETDTKPWTLPRPMLKSGDFNFSFSGLKTAVLYAVKDKLKARTADANQLTDIEKKTLAEEFENAVTEVLVSKTRSAIEETCANTLIIGGGVVANVYIREAFKKLATQTGVTLFTPFISLSTDNSVMIGMAGYLRLVSESARIIKIEDLQTDLLGLKARGNLSL